MTPLQAFKLLNGSKIWLKREDLNHPLGLGNKKYKLRPNLTHAQQAGFEQVLSFGGAFSNHIHALAHLAPDFGLQSIGIIRGEAVAANNPTLTDAVNAGMQLQFVDRSLYKTRDDLNYWQQRFPLAYIIPEGGSNALALNGFESLVTEILQQCPKVEVIAVPCASGGTLAGLVSCLAKVQRSDISVVGISVLKGGDSIADAVKQLLPENLTNWQVLKGFHGGGYARFAQPLAQYIEKVKQQVALEPIYSGKLLYALEELVLQWQGRTVVAIHTGGMQGLRGNQEKLNHLLS